MNERFQLPSGKTRPLAEVVFMPDSQAFFYGGFEVTNYLTVAQKIAVAGDAYDRTSTNNAASDRAYDLREDGVLDGDRPPAPGSDSVLENFKAAVADNPLGGLGGGADGIGGIKKLGSWIQNTLFWLVLAAALWFAWQAGLFRKGKA